MKAIVRKLLLSLALLIVIGVLIVVGVYVCRIATIPTLAKSGGTVLVYEVDVDAFPAGAVPTDFRPEELAKALKRRVDPVGWGGVAVRLVDPTRVEIAVPRAGDHAAYLQQIKDLIAQVGSLEFRILANEEDDKEAIAAARKWFAGDGLSDEEKVRREKPSPIVGVELTNPRHACTLVEQPGDRRIGQQWLGRMRSHGSRAQIVGNFEPGGVNIAIVPSLRSVPRCPSCILLLA